MQLAALQTAKPAERLKHLLPQLFDVEERTGEAFLRFQVTSEITMALPLTCIEETKLLSPAAITPMPNMPMHVLGLMRLRDEILWLTSCARLLGLTTEVERNDRYETIIIRIASDMETTTNSETDLFLGFTVHKIKGSIRLTDAQIAPLAANVKPELQPFLSGQVNQDGETLLLLNPDALVDRSHLDVASVNSF